MACNPNDNTINIFPGIPPQIPGFGNPISIPKISLPDILIPEGIPEDIIELIKKITALLPTGIKLIPNMDRTSKTVWDALKTIFDQLSPFLAFYKFIQALLNIILCIIDVLCSAVNPFSMIRALKRLFKKCLPDFLALFPWLALIAMITALILLLIALIEYIIYLVEVYINQLLENLKVFKKALERDNDGSEIKAAINKIGYLLCLIEEIFAILIAISTLFAIIEPLMGVFGKSVCGPNKSGDGACCEEEFCPPFIANNPTGILSTTGRLIYYSKIKNDITDAPGWLQQISKDLPTPRKETWQFIDDEPNEDASIKDIITPINGNIYWPEGKSYNNTSNIKSIPYLLDMTFYTDPAAFGHNDTKGKRLFNIRDVVVTEKPTTTKLNHDNTTTLTNSGALLLSGGKVFEVIPADKSIAPKVKPYENIDLNPNDHYYPDPDNISFNPFDIVDIDGDGYAEKYPGQDGYKPYLIQSRHVGINEFIRLESNKYQIPIFDDGYEIQDIKYNLKYNHPVLIDNKLINISCNPANSLESAVLNAEFGDLRSVNDKIGRGLPDIGTLDDSRCSGTGFIGKIAESLCKLRNDINEDNVNNFKNDVVKILNDLKTDSEDYYIKSIKSTVDMFKSTVEIIPDVQLINKKIQIKVILFDKSGTKLCQEIPQKIGNEIAKCLKGKLNFGDIEDFVYDGRESFISNISSENEGLGELKVYFENNTFSKTNNRDNNNAPSYIEDRVFKYQFVGINSNNRTLAIGFDEGSNNNTFTRRDNTDV